jgi:anti-sigma factor RsiW
MSHGHHRELLGVYALGALGEPGARALEEHLSACTDCSRELTEFNAIKALLDSVPLEMLLNGPPDGSGLLLKRTLRQVRAERGKRVTSRRVLIGLAAAVAAISLGGGVWIGQGFAPAPEPPNVAQQQPPPQVPAPRVQVASATNPATGSSMVMSMVPAADQIRINASVTGIPLGQHCRLVVVGKDGSREVAMSWPITPVEEKNGSKLDTKAKVAPDNIAAFEVDNVEGHTFVTVPM